MTEALGTVRCVERARSAIWKLMYEDSYEGQYAREAERRKEEEFWGVQMERPAWVPDIPPDVIAECIAAAEALAPELANCEEDTLAVRQIAYYLRARDYTSYRNVWWIWEELLPRLEALLDRLQYHGNASETREQRMGKAIDDREGKSTKLRAMTQDPAGGMTPSTAAPHVKALSNGAKRILNVLADGKPHKGPAIARKANLAYDTVRKLMVQLKKDGHVTHKKREGYHIASNVPSTC